MSAGGNGVDNSCRSGENLLAYRYLLPIVDLPWTLGTLGTFETFVRERGFFARHKDICLSILRLIARLIHHRPLLFIVFFAAVMFSIVSK